MRNSGTLQAVHDSQGNKVGYLRVFDAVDSPIPFVLTDKARTYFEKRRPVDDDEGPRGSVGARECAESSR